MSTGQLLEQRAERCDPDPAGDQQDARPRPPRAGQRAVRTLDVDPRAERNVLEPGGVVPEVLDRQAQPIPVGGGRDREWMGAPPAVAGQEPTDQVLARSDRQPVEVASGQVDRDDSGSLPDDVGDPQSVAQRGPDRLPEPEDEDGRDGQDIQPDPVQAGHRIVGEVGPDHELMGEGQGDGQVGVQVDPVPCLVRQASAGRPHRADRDRHEQREPGDRPQHERVRRDQRPGLADHRLAVAEPIADRRRQGMDTEQPDTAEPDPAVSRGEPVHPERLLQPWAARHEDELDQDKVRPEQGRQLSDRGEEARRRVEPGVPPWRTHIAAMSRPFPTRSATDVGRTQRPRPRTGHPAEGAGRGGAGWAVGHVVRMARRM